MKKVILLFLLTISLFAQNNLIEFDYAKFRYDSSNTYLEVYYYIDQSQMIPIKKTNSLHIEGVLNFKILQGDKLVKEHNLNFSNVFENENTMKNSTPIFGVAPFVLPKGKYNIYLTLLDKNNTKKLVELNDEIAINEWKSPKMQISDIELAFNIIENSNDENSQFHKNGYEIYPNPTMYFTINHPVLFYYYEIYNITKNNKSIKLLTNIYDNLNNSIYNNTQSISNEYEAQVKVGVINLTSFNTGSYTMEIKIIDSIKNTVYSSTKKFFYYNPEKIVNNISSNKSVDFIKSEFNLLSEEEANDMFDKMTYILQKKQINEYNNLNSLEAKRKYLYDFWLEYEKNNEYNLTKDIYFQRVDVANKRYVAGKKQGWKTDRGRVLILYGEPSEYERFPNDLETKPYEIWRYNDVEGGVYFIFADISGFGDYQLISSTKRGELYDEYWQQKIRVVK